MLLDFDPIIAAMIVGLLIGMLYFEPSKVILLDMSEYP